MGLASNNQAQLNAWQQAAGGIRELLLGQGDLTWQQAREAYVEQLETLFPAPVGVDLKTVDMDGVPALLITPENVIDDRALFYIHGGGYVHGGARACCGLAGHYAKGLRARVYLPEYRQAPEFQYPTPIDDVFRAYRALLDDGHGSTRIAMSGDSAGGALVITVMRKARDAGLSLPVAGVALSPWADLTQPGPSAKTRDGLRYAALRSSTAWREPFWATPWPRILMSRQSMPTCAASHQYSFSGYLYRRNFARAADRRAA